MKRLIQGIGKNSASEYDRIFKERQQKAVHWFDIKRWKELIKYYKGGKLIDLGALDSLIPVMARKKYPFEEIWGIDLSRKTMDFLQEKYPSINYEARDLYNLYPSWTGYFSYIILGEVIEHLEKPEEAIKEAMRILKPGGTLALSTPLEETEKGEFDSERHIWSFSTGDILQMLGKYGKVKIEILGSNLFPYKYHPKCIVAWCKKS